MMMIPYGIIPLPFSYAARPPGKPVRAVLATVWHAINTNTEPPLPTHAPSAQSARPCAFPVRPNPPAHAAPYLARSNSSPPTPARCESMHIGAGRRRSVAGLKGESGACPDFPLGFQLKVRSFSFVFYKSSANQPNLRSNLVSPRLVSSTLTV